MLSTCPECGKSYPSHHGKICKLCSEKKNTIIQKTDNKIVLNNNNSSLEKSISKKEDNKTRYKICPHCQAENNPDDAFCSFCKKMLVEASLKSKQEYQLSSIKNIMTSHLNELKKIGIDTNLKLLEKSTNPVKIKILITKTNISESFLMRIINISDLLRIPSLEPEDAFLLETIGINSIKTFEKKSSNDINLLINKNKEILKSKNILVLPSENRINKWIQELKTIEKLIL